MTQGPPIGFGILSWNGHDSLARALASYERERLYALFDETLLFLPEISDRGRDLARRHGIAFAGTASNLGILGGFEALASAMTSEILLLAENDYPVVEPHAEAKRQIAVAARHLTAGTAHVWRFRHRANPGVGLDVAKAERYWPAAGAGAAERATSGVLRLIRPAKAARLAGWTALTRDDADQRFPAMIRRTRENDYLIASRCFPWTNNVFMIRRAFFLDVLLPAARAAVRGRLVNGFPTIETELNRGFWHKGDFRIGMGRGLFTHERRGDRGY